MSLLDFFRRDDDDDFRDYLCERPDYSWGHPGRRENPQVDRIVRIVLAIAIVGWVTFLGIFGFHFVSRTLAEFEHIQMNHYCGAC